MDKLHLDSEYRDRWENFYLANGTVEDSRLKNWRQVAWDQVIFLEACLLGHIHRVDCKGQDFKTFMNFRWGGQGARFDKFGKYIDHREIKIWTIGWTDGVNCFLKNIDFYTGKLLKEYIAPLQQFRQHLHPIVKDKVLG